MRDSLAGNPVKRYLDHAGTSHGRVRLEMRGRIKVGLRADLNVINMETLAISAPYVARDLPSGGKRLLSKATGYDATIVAGQVTYRHGQDTGARPGRLVRSAA